MGWVVNKGHALAVLLPGKSPGTHCRGRWVGLRATLDVYGRSCPHWASNPELSRSYQVTVLKPLSWSALKIRCSM